MVCYICTDTFNESNNSLNAINFKQTNKQTNKQKEMPRKMQKTNLINLAQKENLSLCTEA